METSSVTTTNGFYLTWTIFIPNLLKNNVEIYVVHKTLPIAHTQTVALLLKIAVKETLIQLSLAEDATCH